eukprot:5755238-Ditylum_brightwellii.AAC.2
MGYPSVEEITKNFPQQNIPRIVDKPTYTRPPWPSHTSHQSSVMPHHLRRCGISSPPKPWASPNTNVMLNIQVANLSKKVMEQDSQIDELRKSIADLTVTIRQLANNN